MTSKSPVYFQWQNPHLRKTIYPFREKKLRDFLLIYKEIGLCQEMLDADVEPQIATELIQEVNRVEVELDMAKLRKDEAESSLKDLQKKHREILNSREARILRQKKINLEMKLSSQEAAKKNLENRIDWYEKFAPEHPYYEKWRADLKALLGPYQELKAQIQAVDDEYNQELAPFEKESKALQLKIEELNGRIKALTEDLRKFPRLDKNSTVDPRAAIRWQLLKYERELTSKSHDKLLALILERFDAEPERFPKWLQYMVIHFSGMRYKSAHGSWADPRALLETMRAEEIKQQIENKPESELDRLCEQAKAELTKIKNAPSSQGKIWEIEAQIRALGNRYKRKTALVNHLSAKAAEKDQNKSNLRILGELKARKDQFPEWAWKEVVSRTDLRLEVEEDDWEDLTAEERQERWKYENQHWRQIMNAWERRDITEWRKQHAMTLSLIVTRAVCNEIAEHIQHLRGVKPAAGLAAKPNYFISHQRKDPGRAYFKRPEGTDDFKQGASILFLGWVEREPNAWQVARKLAGVDLLLTEGRPAKVGRRGATDQSEKWNYTFQGDTMIRTARIKVPRQGDTGPKFERRALKEYLRWTHEAIVVEVARLVDGYYVLTFETGQIGLNLRPLGRMVNNWDIFVGYVPPGDVEPENLDDMLEQYKILPKMPEPEMVAFSMPFEAEERTVEHVRQAADERTGMQRLLRRWSSLTPRQRQVAALISQGGTTRRVAAQLGIQPGTVRSHLSKATRKLDLKDRRELRRELAPLDTSDWSEVLTP